MTFGEKKSMTLLGGSSQDATYVVNNHGDRFRPLPLPNGLFMAYKWGLLTTYKSGDDPPSVGLHCTTKKTLSKKHGKDLKSWGLGCFVGRKKY